MKISSPEFENNGDIPKKYTCDGENINPPLLIEDVPEGTKSLALIVDDPDAPSGIWTHWTLWNIGPTVRKIEEGSMPLTALEGKASSGNIGYEGPCPPSGKHRYFFKLYALDRMLGLPEESSVEDLEMEMADHILAETELVGLYGRE